MNRSIREAEDNRPNSGGSSEVSRFDFLFTCASEIEEQFEVDSSLESLDQIYVLYYECAQYVGFSAKTGTQGYFSVSSRDPSDI